MLTMLVLRLKELCSYKAMIALALVCPILFGYIGAYALSEREMALTIAYVDEDKTETSLELLETLRENSGIKLVETSRADGENMINSRKAEGLLTINGDFSEEIYAGARNLLSYKAAPGVSTAGYASEYFALSVVRMRAFNMLGEALDTLSPSAAESARESFAAYASDSPALSVKNRNGVTAGSRVVISPKHGIAAVFVLLAGLFVSFRARGAREARARLRGRLGRAKDYAASALSVIILWLGFIAFYLAAASLVFGFAPSLPEIFAFFSLAVFSVGLGVLASRIFGEGNAAVYIFIPLIFINMTAGGALWGGAASSPALKYFLPLALFTEACGGATFPSAFMLVAGLAIIVGAEVFGPGAISSGR